MASPYTKGALVAAKLGDAFDLDKIVVGAATIGDSETGVTVSHGLAATPEFVQFSWFAAGAFTSNADTANAKATASSTEIRFSWAETDNATTVTVSYIAGLLS